MKMLAEFARSHAESIKRLYDASGAERFGVARAAFAAALHRGCESQFGDAAVQSAQAAKFLETLHAGDLALALACVSGNENAWAEFHDRFRPTVERFARQLTHNPTEARDLADSLWGDLYGVAAARARANPRSKVFPDAARGSSMRLT